MTRLHMSYNIKSIKRRKIERLFMAKVRAAFGQKRGKKIIKFHNQRDIYPYEKLGYKIVEIFECFADIVEN